VVTKFVVRIKILAIEFSGRSKGILVATWFTTIEMGSVSITHKPILGNLKVPLTWVDSKLT